MIRQKTIKVVSVGIEEEGGKRKGRKRQMKRSDIGDRRVIER